MKLIALRPLEGCNSKYLKLLSTKELYLLCNNYEIDKEDKIVKITSLPAGFFSSMKPEINVQAIVGKNGSVKSRLIANLLLPCTDNHFRKITKNLYASHLVLSTNRDTKRHKILYTKSNGKTEQKITIKELLLDEEYLLNRLDHYYNFGYKNLDKKQSKVAIDYIIYKLVSIALKYYNHEDNYFSKDENRFNESKLDHFFDEIFNDASHITLKLRQTINFLKFKHVEFKKQTLSLDNLSKINSGILSIQSKRKRREVESIELVPPPIFNTEILLTPVNGKEKRVPFRMLSSGEKQMIYSVSSILYHILNLESVSSNTKKRTAYRYINVILEEVEMYAHPEMQRNYIKYIIESIERLSLKRTLGINLCFVTHSPFILSDIPGTNILFLNEVGTPELLSESLKTFGGNIHDLLAHSFFLKDGAIGAFALEKINKMIKQLTDENARGNEDDKTDLLKNIQLIGEPFLRNKLLDMYYIKFDKRKRVDELEAELKKFKAND